MRSPKDKRHWEAQRPRTIAGNYQSQRTRQSSKNETTPVTVQSLNTPILKTQFSKGRPHQNGVTKRRASMPAPEEQGTAGTRKETHMLCGGNLHGIRKKTTSTRIWSIRTPYGCSEKPKEQGQ